MPATIHQANIHPAKKMLFATIVLAIGVGLAWPFRIQSEPSRTVTSVEILPSSLGFSPAKSLSQNQQSPSPSPFPKDEREGFGISPAKLTATELPRLPVGQFDEPITRRAINRHRPTPSLPARYEADFDLQETDTPRPAYATTGIHSFSAGDTPTQQSAEIIHEVENSDTLAKLAKRYLGDPARSLEIFDLNRDKLSNPHLLPIGAELRIKTNAEFGLRNAE